MKTAAAMGYGNSRAAAVCFQEGYVLMGRRVDMKRFFYTLIQCTWGLPQTAVGFLLFLYWRLRGCPWHCRNGGICTHWYRGGGVSLGLFFFCEPTESLIRHEYGHTVQSLLLGPLYLPAVALPSLLWCGLRACREYRRRTGTPYSRLYCEKWADILGERFGKLRDTERKA